MGTSEKFCLRWNDFESSISGSLRDLREEKDFFDVTLSCGDEQLQAHKVILSACSPFFRNILRRNKHEHPLLYLKGMRYADLVSVLNFMYQGEVNVAQEDLNSFLAVAEDLKVKGLTQSSSIPSPNHSRPSGVTQPRIHQSPSEKKRPQLTSPYLESLSQKNTTDNLTDNDDIQEILPIKSEPTTHHPLEALTAVNHVTHTFSRSITEDDDGVVVNPDTEDYSMEFIDYEEYGAQGTSYHARGVIVGQEDNRDVESLVQSFMKKTTDEFNTSVWQCLQCGKVSKVSTNLKDHIEANHIEGLQFECSKCLKIFKSRPSLRTHMRLHK